ncbi:hypothetical protein EYF80_006771 [Liparis tanakae]|uniref:Uncharacterized protein n=1 Tax=Liparis tanakae TaxID=230148 RepID=A0A4Z2IZ35_9TELE|nr:hypothetical protein EYF80_006771 [Liparis tanakae]
MAEGTMEAGAETTETGREVAERGGWGGKAMPVKDSRLWAPSLSTAAERNTLCWVISLLRNLLGLDDVSLLLDHCRRRYLLLSYLACGLGDKLDWALVLVLTLSWLGNDLSWDNSRRLNRDSGLGLHLLLRLLLKGGGLGIHPYLLLLDNSLLRGHDGLCLLGCCLGNDSVQLPLAPGRMGRTDEESCRSHEFSDQYDALLATQHRLPGIIEAYDVGVLEPLQHLRLLLEALLLCLGFGRVSCLLPPQHLSCLSLSVTSDSLKVNKEVGFTEKDREKMEGTFMTHSFLLHLDSPLYVDTGEVEQGVLPGCIS